MLYNLYKFDRSHENFDLHRPNMIMQCSHIYFPGDKIHNKIMEWDHGRDFNVFNMIEQKTVKGPLQKKKFILCFMIMLKKE